MTERIGFIGLGLMGKPMSHHLLTGGYALTVFNLSTPLSLAARRNFS